MVEEDTEFVTFDGDTISKSDFRDEIINKYISAGLDGLTKISDFTIGSEAYHLADVMASYILEHRELVDTNYRMSMIHTAEGEFLDNFGDMVGVHRIASSGAVGTVTFTRLNIDNTSAPIVIADGTQVATDDAISFLVDNDGENAVIDVGATSVTVDVICEQEGAYTNVEANTITLVMDEIGSLVSVTNESAMTGGTDIESDDDYRARILLAPFEFPVGSLKWYENTCLGLDSVHDVKCEKGQTQLDADVIINFNPTDRTDVVTRTDLNDYNEDNSIESTSTGVMTKARQDLIELFSMKEYDIVGITRDYHLAGIHSVLGTTASATYYFALILKESYSLNTAMKTAIANKITAFNSDAMISVEFNPSTIASIIENEVEGILSCRIVAKDSSDNYTEVVEPITIEDNQVYQIDTTNLSDRIRELRFNLDIELEE